MKKKQKVFICYRRENHRCTAGRLRDSLEREFGERYIFLDVINIPAGENYEKIIEENLDESRCFLLLIGENFASILDMDGMPKIKKDEDPVRIEIAHALKKRLIIIPVFIDEAKMPQKDSLPKSIQKIRQIHGLTIRHDYWHDDLKPLTASVQKALEMDTDQGSKDFEINIVDRLFTDYRRGKHTYEFIEIIDHLWLTENYRLKTPNSWAYGSDESNIQEYGRLYSWRDAHLACPEGWQLPTEQMWNELLSFARKSEENRELVSLVMTGRRKRAGEYFDLNLSGYYWGKSTRGDDFSWYYQLNSKLEYSGHHPFRVENAFACRYVKQK